jgi:hypothetical protein
MTQIRKRPMILPYSRRSMSAKTVSRHFRTLRIFADKNYRPRQNDVIINWGYNHPIVVAQDNDVDILNKPEDIKKASSKVECLTILEKAGVPTPRFATNKEDAKELFNNTDLIYCRTLTRASKGKGIELATKVSELVNCNLYTARLDVDIEYRVHVFDNEIIDVVQKRRMTKERMADKGIKERNDLVRNLMNGWSFTRGSLTLKDEDGDYLYGLIDVTLEAVKALNLDFGAIDLIKTKNDEFYVLEVNTAPGMKKGTTTHRRYIKAISNYCNIPFSDSEFTKRYEIENTHDNNLNNFLNSYKDD